MIRNEYCRDPHGHILSLLAVTCCLLTIVGFGFVNVARAMTRASQLVNAADAGVLTVAKQAAAFPAVALQADAGEQQFRQIAGDDGDRIRLRNINLVWGRTLLVSINAEAMVLSGQAAAGVIRPRVDAMIQAANNISFRLSRALQSSTNISPVFLSTAQENTLVRRANIRVSTVQASYVDRGEPSHIYYCANQVPPVPLGFAPKIQAIPDPTNPGKLRLTGYVCNPLQFGEIFFVPLRARTQSHLISAHNFDLNLSPAKGSPAFNWPSALPNAFGVLCKASTDTVGQTVMQQAASYAQSECIGQEQALSIDDGFLRIENDTSLNISPLQMESILNSLLVGPSLPKQRLAQIKPDFQGSPSEVAMLVGGQAVPAKQKAYVAGFSGNELSLRLESGVVGTPIQPRVTEPPDGLSPGLKVALQPPMNTFPAEVYFIPSTFYNQLGGVVRIVPK